MDRGIMAWFELIEVRFAGIFMYADEQGRPIDLTKI